MYKGKRILAVIPARAGSKGIKDKNIIDLCGKPLIAYSIESALDSKYIDKIVVSTDGENIAKIAREWGAEVPFLRPDYLSHDKAKSIDVLLHCIEEVETLGEKFDYVVLLQPTQPLRKSFHIDEAIELIVKENADNLVSICKVKEHPVLMRTIDEEGEMKNLLNCSSTQRRQDFKDFYKINGVIYINKINKNLNSETSLNDNTLPYIMDEQYSIDIDELLDVKIATLMLEEMQNIKEL
ncbi:cytidylyltransferase domain-containing protein [Clostridium tarantellae]|uniref:Acylneuraminate cytidylyltransferase family protein n=1 Tax=Clostridium tarantellae TaxID=39493 RepID=A0A6I1MKE5_9CLOT|nr:acylneuraminate cytidylyltransferase family protein [Clostridium tarantellae]MPQ43500.1 acylneuraminate cytidylyltransferase family protein [Clostridium tarantellae]